MNLYELIKLIKELLLRLKAIKYILEIKAKLSNRFLCHDIVEVLSRYLSAICSCSLKHLFKLTPIHGFT